jgi:hypothetical protein
MLIEILKDNVGVLQRSTIKSLLNLPTFSRNRIKFSSIHPRFVGLYSFAWKVSAASPSRCAKGDFFAAQRLGETKKLLKFLPPPLKSSSFP